MHTHHRPARRPAPLRWPIATLMLTLLAALAGYAPRQAQAQIYQCVLEGKTTFQGLPCDPGSTSRQLMAVTPQKMVWDDLRPGMSVEEIQKKLPAAVPTESDRLANGDKALLRIDNLRLAGNTLNATLFFNNARFTQINLAGPMATGNSVNLAAARKITEEFRLKYGRESLQTATNWEWLNQRGKIWVTLVPVGANTSMLSVGFKPTPASPAEQATPPTAPAVPAPPSAQRTPGKSV